MVNLFLKATIDLDGFSMVLIFDIEYILRAQPIVFQWFFKVNGQRWFGCTIGQKSE